ncbi:MAG: double-strand break repair protein AddB [Boseongicola sp. SB0677_bin_26]|nr:double-strand break repair protein AddB [Boseongicola sp. SB0665_bin_10]MYG28420.1 double-strand break repair protein AddB [Boseongicola sp. SB0677_bin_26]
MFDPSGCPRVFGVPPGADFPQVVVERILDAHAGRPPENLARVRLLVNSRRMQRRFASLFRASGPLLLPRILLVTEIERILPGIDLPRPVSRLRRQLELAQLTARLVDAEPDLAHPAAAVSLADSLASLLDEIQGEGIAPGQVRALEIGDDSLHWQRSLKFLDIVGAYVESASEDGLDFEARRRLGVEQVSAAWASDPPDSPVIIAGSTGSRTTTRMLMCAVARLPQGALVLPGFDVDLPGPIWDSLGASRDCEDHPQYRFAALFSALGMARDQVATWGEPPDKDRNTLVSLSLRPAQVTDQWLSEGPGTGDLRRATSSMALVEASESREEAQAISVAIREAVQQGERSALVTRDQDLVRRVSASLSRWDIAPDNSFGMQLSLTPPGTFLLQVGRLVGESPRPEDLIALLKHPLTRVGTDRGFHLANTRQLELFLRRNSVHAFTEAELKRFADGSPDERREWISWLESILGPLGRLPSPTLLDAVTHHLELAESISGGNDKDENGLWAKSSGRLALATIDRFLAESDFGEPVTFADYLRLLERTMQAERDRDLSGARHDVTIWGAREARVQGPDLVILGGLNEGRWPEQPDPDPWLNRRMRASLGLPLPEGQTGLAAHDYQQAIAARRVVLSRSSRDGDGDAVPSRWVNRLTNLLEGLPGQSGPEALVEMRQRGDRLLALAGMLDRPARTVKPESRPAPSPPSDKRPKKLSVTEIQRLIRDPYAIYARHVLRLRPLLPLVPEPDVRLKGTVFHAILAAFAETAPADKAIMRQRLLQIADEEFRKDVPWPAIRAHWRGHLEQIADWLVSEEVALRAGIKDRKAEVSGELRLGATGLTISGKADRIDRLSSGELVIYDYKTGGIPSEPQILHFDRQLLIEAVMAERGAFEGVPEAPVGSVSHISIGRSPKRKSIKLEGGFETGTVHAELIELLERFQSPGTGYISRRAMEKMRFRGDYDHLARFGEWDASATTRPRPVE